MTNGWEKLITAKEIYQFNSQDSEKRPTLGLFHWPWWFILKYMVEDHIPLVRET